MHTFFCKNLMLFLHFIIKIMITAKKLDIIYIIRQLIFNYSKQKSFFNLINSLKNVKGVNHV